MAAATAAAGSTPASQFSPGMLAQLIQAQTDQAQGSTDLASQQPGQTQGAHHGHHHHHAGGAGQASGASDPTATTDAAGVAVPSTASGSQAQSLAAQLLS